MILKSVEMQGFKSFADKIYLDFNSGITAIVGPNGSGKSNISDAIRWVMGEQSIKSLRGSKMEDVIFAGTESRKALGFAEVTLHLNNQDNIFDIEFPEVSVTRRLYRSGESEYYINKTLCRLKDVHELFMDTGLGRDGYSMVGQGQIDSILSTKSEDRRQIFEEASGISKYKYRKIEAERKLSHTNDNICRVNDILSELTKQLEPLKRQSEKAKKFLVLRDEMKELEINVSVVNIDNKRAALTKLKEDIDIYSSQIKNLENELSEIDQRISDMFKKSDAVDSEAEQKRNGDKALSDEINTHTNRNNIAENDIKHSQDSIKRLHSEIAQNSSKAAEIEDEAKKLNSELNSLTVQREEIEKKSGEVGAKTAEFDSAVKNQSKIIEDIRSAAIHGEADISSKKSLIESKKILIDNFNSRVQSIDIAINEREAAKNDSGSKVEKLTRDISDLYESIRQIKSVINSIEEKYGEKNAEMQRLISEKNRSNIDLGQLYSKRKVLTDMERSLEGYSRGVKSVMSAYQKRMIRNVKIHAPLSQLISVDGRYVTAIETALGSAAQNIVTDTADDAKLSINYLKQNRLGRATFLPISSIKRRGRSFGDVKGFPGFIGAASELVQCDERFSAIVDNILGGTAIVDNIDNAVLMGKKYSHKFKIVTLGGDVVQAGGAMTGGSTLKSAGSLSRGNEIKELSAKIDDSEALIVKLTKDINSYSIECSGLMEDSKNNNEKLTAYNERLIQLTSEKKMLEEIFSSDHAELEKLSAERKSLSSSIEELSAEISDIALEIERTETELSNLRERETEEQKLFSELTGKNESLAQTALKLSMERNSLIKDIERLNEKLRGISREKSQLKAASEYKNTEISELKDRILELDSEITERRARIRECEAKREDAARDLQQLISEKQRIDKEIKTQQESSGNIRNSLLDLSKQNAKTQTRYENLEGELEAIIDRLWEEYELTYSDAAENADLSSFDYSSSASRIAELKKSIKSLGNINIDSIEEYKNVKERVDFLTLQTEDLQKSKRELNKLISDMTAIMKERFSKQFSIINQNFSRVFSELFGGGRANLSLADPDNVLESGIEIEAQPPGKKLQSLTLLSGGERAFTAIALLFAILDVRPTPFCMLDEIEAALDDVNVYRFADYLKSYSSKTQFIVVTHRRGTMEAANILYGVTMQEKGISKILSLNIDEVGK